MAKKFIEERDALIKQREELTSLLDRIHREVEDNHLKLLKGGKLDQDQVNNYLVGACISGNLEEAQACISAGADINYRGKDGFTPILAALRSGNEPLIMFILSHKPDMRIKKYGDESAIHLCADLKQSIIKKVLAAGAKINARDNKGRTVFHHTRSSKNLAFLIKQGADPTIKDKGGMTALERRKDYGARPALVNKWIEVMEDLSAAYQHQKIMDAISSTESKPARGDKPI